MFKEYRVGNLFDIHPTKTYKMSNSELYEIVGNTPVLSNSSINNGIGGYSGLNATEKGGIITFSDTTTGGDTLFYQAEDFIGYSHVQGMYPFVDFWDEKCCLYAISAIHKAAGDGWNYAVKFNRNLVKELMIKLPVIESFDVDHEYTVDDLDWNYMREYITEMEYECITDLECERNKELDAYLQVTEFDDYELNEEDKIVLLEKPTFREFEMQDIFEKLKASYKGAGKKQDNVSKIQNDEFNLPLINCKYNNNGIMYYGRKSDYTYYNNVLSIIYNGPPTEGQTYFQEEIGVYTDAYLITLKDKSIKVNREIGLYLTSIVNVSIHNEKHRKYSRGNKATWKNKVEKDIIYLPIKSDGTPDFDYMKRYIRTMEKVVIADKIKYKDKIIEETKKIVNSA